MQKVEETLWQLLLFCILNRVPPLQCDLACLWQEPKLGGASWSVIYSWLLYPRVSFCLQGPLSFLKLFAVLGQWTQIQPSAGNRAALPWYVWPSPEQKTPLRDLDFQHRLHTLLKSVCFQYSQSWTENQRYQQHCWTASDAGNVIDCEVWGSWLLLGKSRHKLAKP